MPYSKSKYTKAQTQALTLAAMEVLADSQQALTVSDICARKISLQGQTTQKMSRCLNDLVEMGMVKKTKNKAGRMVYMATSQLIEQGYEV